MPIPCLAREVRDFHNAVINPLLESGIDFLCKIEVKPVPNMAFIKRVAAVCTISGHGAVNGVHSTENMRTYKRVFFID